MFRTILLLASMLGCAGCCSSCAEPCSGDRIIESEEDIEDLRRHCKKLYGSLIMEYYQDGFRTDLVLPCLLSVEEDLDIISNGGLSSVELSSLKEVGGDVHFLNNHVMTAIHMPGLTSVVGCLRFNDNFTLTTIDMSELDDVAGDLSFGWNDELITLGGFSNLVTVHGDVRIYDTSLRSLDGLTSLRTVYGSLSIYDNPMLCRSEVEAFMEGVDAVGGYHSYYNGEQRDDCP